MKLTKKSFSIHQICSFLWLIAFVATLLAHPRNAYAAMGISSIEPTVFSNQSATELRIQGTEFVDGAVVTMGGDLTLTTTFISATELAAVVPAEVNPGYYSITVANPDGSTATINNAVRVVEPSSTPTPFTRPLIVIDTYKTSVSTVSPGEAFDLIVKLHNSGMSTASNIVLTFPLGDFVPRSTGGVLSVPEMASDHGHRFEQPLTATADIAAKAYGTLNMEVTYTDPNGQSYSETFTISIPVTRYQGGPRPTSTPTPTATLAPNLRPQLVINSYKTDVVVLQPGNRFTLNMQVANVGNESAKRVTMILGGGSSSGSGSSGTPAPGGVSGAGGDFGNFAPVASSNVQFIGDLGKGSTMEASASLIVNATTNPGAYPMKISFTYIDETGGSYTDDQVITLLVYSLPQVMVNFYRDPGMLIAGQPNALPIQVVNVGRKASTLGNLVVTGEGGEFSNNSLLVGLLDTGYPFTADPMVVPFQPGTMELQIKIDYTDDFNQPQTITRTLSVEVMEAPPVEPGGEGQTPGEGVVTPGEQQPETLGQKILRFIRGLFGLDSGRPTQEPGNVPPVEMPAPVEGGKPRGMLNPAIREG